jgi:hypothetical protein
MSATLAILDCLSQLVIAALAVSEWRRQRSYEAMPRTEANRFTASIGTNTPLRKSQSRHTRRDF